MTTLFIPDIHNKIDIVERILAKHERPLTVYYAGDYFDDFGDSPGIAADTAKWLVRRLEHPEQDLTEHRLIGNHDAAYLFPELNSELWCSGYTPDKAIIIASHLHKKVYRDQFHLHARVGNWLLTHAGLTMHWYQHFCEHPNSLHNVGNDPFHKIDLLINTARTYLDANVCHAIMRAGADRGGKQAHGGITWCDWNSLQLIPGVNQIVGHTQGRSVRRRNLSAHDMMYQNICMDTRLQNYAVYVPETDSWKTQYLKFTSSTGSPK